MASCAVASCSSRKGLDKKENTGISFHKFPKDPEYRELWVRFVNRPRWKLTNHSVICSKHFSSNYMDTSSPWYTKMKDKAIPTLHGDPISIETEDSSHPTKLSLKTRNKPKKCEEEQPDSVTSESAKSSPNHLSTLNHDSVTESVDPPHQAETNAREDALNTELDEKLQFLSSWDLSRICRICLQVSGEVKLLENQYNSVNYFDILEEIACLKLKREKPLSVCTVCEDSLIKAYTFKLQTQESEHTLEKLDEQKAKQIPLLDHDYGFTPSTLATTLIQSVQATPVTNPKKIYLFVSSVEGDVNSGQLVQINKTAPVINNRYLTKRAFQLARAGHLEEAKRLTKDLAKIPKRLLKILNRKPKREKVTYPTDCNTCGDHLETEEDYKKHVRLTKHFHTPFPCDHCSKVFPSEKTLDSHKKNLLLQTSKLCDKCGASFSTTSGLHSHVRVMHTGREKYKCGVCGKVQADMRRLKRHRVLVHPGVHMPKTKVCEFCGLKLGSKASLSTHKKRVHFNIRPAKCMLCDAKFHTGHQLRKHDKAIHSMETFDCGFCNKSFKHQEKFDSHRRLRHPALPKDADVSEEQTPSQCTICEGLCPNKQALSVHMREHSIDVCIYCDEIFQDDEELGNHHLDQHEDTSEWTCRYCNKCYEDGDSLYSHLTTHKYRSFKCEECPKMFDTSNKLKRHKMLHDGVANYGCQFCPKRFVYSSSAVIHERIHTGERPYKCDICGSSHICASSRSKHRQTHFIDTEDSLTMEILATEVDAMKHL